jgi:hypothetical protein
VWHHSLELADHCDQLDPSDQALALLRTARHDADTMTPLSDSQSTSLVLVRIRELVSPRGSGAVLTDAICPSPPVATDLAPMWQLRT